MRRGTGGCAGGTAELAYGRLADLTGIPSEWTYPYTSGTGQAGTCHGLPLPYQRPHTGMVMGAANVTGHVSLPKNQYLPMLKAIATLGPLAISVDAGKWHDYEEGVFTGGNKTDPQLDHLVQLVGCALWPSSYQPSTLATYSRVAAARPDGTDPTYGDYWLVRRELLQAAVPSLHALLPRSSCLAVPRTQLPALLDRSKGLSSTDPAKDPLPNTAGKCHCSFLSLSWRGA
eukprot:COSAG01_NODE_4628_length_4864_cov_36.015530_2_plen_230_part_00